MLAMTKRCDSALKQCSIVGRSTDWSFGNRSWELAQKPSLQLTSPFEYSSTLERSGDTSVSSACKSFTPTASFSNADCRLGHRSGFCRMCERTDAAMYRVGGPSYSYCVSTLRPIVRSFVTSS